MTAAATTPDLKLSKVKTIPWNRLRASTENMRRVKPHHADDQALIANIASVGEVLENLIVAPLEDEDGCFGVHAGGRRYSAVGVLVERGTFPEDFPIPCRVQVGGSLAAISLAENLRAATHPADEFDAMKKMVDDGMSIESIAESYAIPVIRVKRRLRLAEVHTTILNAFRRGDIALDAVMAFTLAPSKKEQLRVFKEMPGRIMAWRVKQAFTGDDSMKTDDRLVRYVGLEAYQAEGGTVVADMFADHDHVTDPALVGRLAEAKLAASAERLLKREGWKDAITRIETFHSYQHDWVKVEAEAVGVPAELTDRIDALKAERDALHEKDCDWTEEDEERDEQIADALEQAETEYDSYREFTDEQKAGLICFVAIGNNGKVRIERGYRSRRAGQAEAKKTGSTGEAAPKPLPQALLTDLGNHRELIGKVALLSNDAIANDVLLLVLVREVLDQSYHHDNPLNARFDEVAPTSEELIESKAGKKMASIREKLPLGFLGAETTAEQYAALRKLTPKRKQALQTFCVAALFQCRINRGSDTLTDVILNDLAPDYTGYFRPTSENYFKRLTRQQLIALGEEMFGDDFDDWADYKKGQLVLFFHDFFNKPLSKSLTDEQRERHAEIRANWLPNGFVEAVEQ